jgi:potassium-transporting ATPase potassium-binding subunit
MTLNGFMQLTLYLVILLLLVKPLGLYMARVYSNQRHFLTRPLQPLEAFIYRFSRVDPKKEQNWQQYTLALLALNVLGFIVVYLLQRLQAVLPLNPQAFTAVTPDLAFNTAISFATNTNWQSYGGETTMSYLTQMLGLGVQNFLSAASGMAVLIALIRGFIRRETSYLGNFWVDATRGILYILLPLATLLALILVSQGVVQSFAPYRTVDLVQSQEVQTVPLGPAASQIAIKQLGTNGGGFFNVNSAHPLENPSPVSNFMQLLAILLIPAALCYTLGELVKDRRQGWVLLSVMLLIFIPITFAGIAAEQAGNPLMSAQVIDQQTSNLQAGGNMEGKETRFGIVNSVLWTTATTAASNGSVNSMLGSYTPLGGLMPLWLIQLGEVIFGGTGSGLYGMLMFAIVAVLLAGLMIGRTPEYLGKKIEAYEIKMAALALLIPCAIVLLGTAVACLLPAATSKVGNPGPHGFAEILYAFSSAGNNNGSAFGGLSANNPFYNFALGSAMWLSRYWLMIVVLAMAGSLATKRTVAYTSGTLVTSGPLFVALLTGVVLLIGALTFVPALALGPVIEHLQLIGHQGTIS